MSCSQDKLSLPMAKFFRIDAILLIPGRGKPIQNAALVFEGNTIKFVGSRHELPEAYHGTHPIESVPVLMPGLWDCHCHFLGAKKASISSFIINSQAEAGARSAKDVTATLNAGFTSVRELAGYGVDLKPAIDDGWLTGPNIYSSVSPISMTAGHGDGHSLPVERVNESFHHGVPFYICDGVEECIKAVRLQIRRGARIIKICATGGATSLIDSPHGAQFSIQEIRAMVEEAERANMIVAAHCHGTNGILNAIRAGCKTIEHGSFLTDEAIQLMLKNDVMLIATRSIFKWGVKHPELMDEVSYKKMKQVEESNGHSLTKAIKAGIKIAIGTDLGLSGPETDFHHGTNGLELVYAVEAGMTPLQAIEAGTANAPASLGPQGPLSGQLKQGYDADFIALSSSPLDDIRILSNPKNITHVWKGGKLFKSPGKPLFW